MKKSLFLAVLLVTFSSVTFAASIEGGRYNPKSNSIEFDVRYGGGCLDHDFKFSVGDSCKESYPVQCRDAKLVDNTTDDHCKAIVNTTVSFTLEEAGLADSYFNGARLTVTGDEGGSVQINLPFKQ